MQTKNETFCTPHILIIANFNISGTITDKFKITTLYDDMKGQDFYV